MQAARLLKALPEIEAKLEKGEVTLTTLTKVQSTIYREEKRSGNRMKVMEKEAILAQVAGKPEYVAEKVLVGLFPLEAKKESLRQTSGTESRLSVSFDEEIVTTLKEIRDHLSHALPNASWAEVIAYVVKDFKKRKIRAAPVAPGVTAGKSCEYKDSKSGRQCGSTYQLETDHILPKALGGSNDPKNLRTLCKQHNLLEAERCFGKEEMQKYRRSG